MDHLILRISGLMEDPHADFGDSSTARAQVKSPRSSNRSAQLVMLEALEEWHLNASGCIAKVNELEATNKALQSSLVDAENRQNERWLHEYAQQDNAFEAGGEMYYLTLFCPI